MAAAVEPRIHAVVADSAWSDVWHWIRPGTHSAVRIDDRFSPLSLKLVELRAGIDLDAIRPVDVIGRIEPRPVLLLHGTADDVVVSQNATLNIAAAGPHAKLWTIPGGRHGTSLEDGGAAASQRVIDFLSRALYREEAA
jgi:fermentation-respiration switch protein FrsA (DUF1100 family)